MSLYARDPDDLARVEEIVARLREELKSDPNIVQIAPGLKISGGRVVPDELIITFFVRAKLPLDALRQRGFNPIPSEIDGIPTDVEIIDARPLGALDKRGERRDPLVGGIAIGNGNYQFHWGTLGGIVFDNVTGVAKALTNEHVLVFTNEGKTGDPVIQPAPPRIQDYIDLDFTPDCCPVGPIFFVETGGPVSAFLTWAAVVAGIAACSDVRDPTRRGEDSTIPAPGEKTLREQVDVAIRYPNFPIPGTPYKVDVQWDYKRFTTGATYTHQVKETNTNPHVLVTQRLVTDQKKYRPGETIHLLATLVSDSPKPCAAFHAIAYLVPVAAGDRDRAHKVVLHPVSGVERERLRRLFDEIRDPQTAEEQCDDFKDIESGTALPSPFHHHGLIYENVASLPPLRTSDWIPAGAPDGVSELAFGRAGIRVRLPVTASFVSVLVAQLTPQPVEISAFDVHGNRVGHAVAPNVQATLHRLERSAAGVVEVVIAGGGGEAVLQRLCYGRAPRKERCHYYGRTILDLLDPLGPWRTHLFAQTINDVPLGMDPEKAAQTIGGLPVTQNFEYIGEGTVPPHGAGCVFRPKVDGDFELVVS